MSGPFLGFAPLAGGAPQLFTHHTLLVCALTVIPLEPPRTCPFPGRQEHGAGVGCPKESGIVDLV